MSANDELFDREDFEDTPLLRGIEQLCAETGRTVESLESLTMGQVVTLAREHYGDDLPEIWRIWIDWQEGDAIQPMGDL